MLDFSFSAAGDGFSLTILQQLYVCLLHLDGSATEGGGQGLKTGQRLEEARGPAGLQRPHLRPTPTLVSDVLHPCAPMILAYFIQLAFVFG